MLLAEQLLAAGLVLCLLGLAVWAFGRGRGLAFPSLRRRARTPGALAVLERAPLTAQHVLHLVRVGDQSLLVATFPGGIAFHSEQQFTEVFKAAVAKAGEPVK